VEVSPELPDVLQEFWDRQWSKSNNVVLILCGSFLGFMERNVLGPESPLYGRRTGSIHLQPFSHVEARNFHPHLSTDDHARVYGICGGIPAYLKSFEDDLSVEQNIVASILTPGGQLDGEPEYLLREELRELVPYHTVLMSLADGVGRPADLSKKNHMDSRAVNYYLKTLVDIGYVKKRHPLTDPPSDERTVRYALDDPILRFWFRFVFPNLSSLRSLGPSAAFADIIRPELDSYYGYCFERLCRESLGLIYVTEGVRTSFDVGEFWRSHGKKVQIDVVGVRRDNWTDLGECKWGDDYGSLSSLADVLEAKVLQYPNERGATIGRRLFVRQIRRKHDAPPGIRVHTLADLYALPPPP
jgi:AAA+ ATPase superfamily predicted ATPase